MAGRYSLGASGLHALIDLLKVPNILVETMYLLPKLEILRGCVDVLVSKLYYLKDIRSARPQTSTYKAC